MSEQYRLASPLCPLCRGPLEEHPVPGALVDVCVDCHAVWIDWFDGDVATVARHVRTRAGAAATRPGDNACPRCRDELVSEELRGHGPRILRCPSCAGVLVPSSVIDEVVALGPPEDAPPAPEQGPLDRLFAALRGLFKS